MMAEPVAFLLGAGSSYPFGIPLMRGFYTEFRVYIRSRRPQCDPLIEKIESGHQKSTFDLEILLAAVQTILSMPEAHKMLGIPDDDVAEDIRLTKELRGYLDAFIIDRCERFDRETACDSFRPFLEISSHVPLWLFSTNYDRIIEHCCEELDIPCADGFEGDQTKPVLSWSGKFSPPVSLIKLHGSVNWYENTEDDSLHKLDRGYSVPSHEFNLARKGQPFRSLMILPTLEKGVARHPYSVLGIQFSDTLRDAKLLVIAGNSIRDEHIRGHILGRLESLVVLIVDPSAAALTRRFNRPDRVIGIDIGFKQFLDFAPPHLLTLLQSISALPVGEIQRVFDICEQFSQLLQEAFASDLRTSPDLDLQNLAVLSLDGPVSKRVVAVTELGTMGGTNVETHLIGILAHDSNAAIRIAVVDALSARDSKKVVESLLQSALNDDDKYVRLEAALALRKLSSTQPEAAVAFDTLKSNRELAGLIGDS